MSITIWTGASGTGKTSAMFDEIIEANQDNPLGSNIYIITPTQNTLTYEGRISKTKDGQVSGSMRTGVYSFQRLMWHIYNEIGQPDKSVLSQAGHVMFIHNLMNEIKDDLNYYQTSQGYIKFSEKVLEQIIEFRAYNIEAEDLLDLEFSKGRTTEKYKDLSMIYSRWMKEINKYKVEDLNQIQQFINDLNDTNKVGSLKDAVIYIDGFHNFTESEFMLIHALEKRVKQVNLLLTHEKRDSEAGRMDIELFRKTEAVINRLQEIFGENYLDFRYFNHEFLRSKKEGISQLEGYLTNGQKITNYDGVTIIEAMNPQEEIVEVARNIEYLVREKGARYSDIGILYRDQAYENQFKSVFKEFDIAYHLDSEHLMHKHPFTGLIIALFDCYRHKFQSSAFLNLLKTGYLNTEENDAQSLLYLENLIVERGLTGRELFVDERFTREYRLDEDGEIKEIDNSEALEEMILYKNDKLRQLDTLFKELDEAKTVREFSLSLYQFIKDGEIDKKVQKEIEDLSDRNIQLANETEQAYNLFIRLLDDSYTVFKDREVDFELFYETFYEGLKTAKFNSRPAAIDQVIIGLLDLAKVENKKYIFMVGMNYNVMPAESRNTAIVTDDEKDVLEERGIILSPSARTLARDERFVFYIGATKATDHLFISWAKTLHNKEETKISPFVFELLPKDSTQVLNYSYHKVNQYQVQNILALISSMPSMEALEHQQLRALMSYNLEDLEDLTKVPQYRAALSVYQILKEKAPQTIFKRLRRNLSYDNRARKISSTSAEALYGEEMKASVSRFQSYFSCHFQHFANYGMKLNVRKDFSVKPLEIGNLYHNALEQIVHILDKTLDHDDAVILEAIQKSVDNVLRTISYGIFERSEYYLSLKEKVIVALSSTLMFMKDLEKLGNYKISLVEASFGKDSDDLGKLVLHSPNGKKIYLRGKIDRVDSFKHDGQVFVNIVDYKSSGKDLRKQDVLNGIELQIMTYMYILMERASEKLGGEILPNSMLFYHVNSPRVEADNEEDVIKERRKEHRPKGLFVLEEETLQGNVGLENMIDEDQLSTFLPLKEKKDGTLDKNSARRVMTPSMFKHYLSYVMKQFETATDDIYQGNTLANPMETSNGLPCRFCDFKAACHIDKLINEKDYRVNEWSLEDIEAFESEVNDG